MSRTRWGAIAALVATAMIVTGCMLVPGKFASELELHRDGRFTYRYDGEIYLLALSQLAEAGGRIGGDGDGGEFVAQPCYDEEEWEEAAEEDFEAEDAPSFADAAAKMKREEGRTQDSEEAGDTPAIIIVDREGPSDEAEAAAAEAMEAAVDAYVLDERECTAEELAEQREAHDERQERRRKEAEQQAQIMNLFFGGIDPSDPEAAEELVRRLKRQRGWNRVEYLGDGKFDVSFEITSVMGHDFVFPTFERFPLNNFILTAALRAPNTVRIDAPGFAVQGGTGPFGGMMSGMVGMMQIFGDEMDEEGSEEGKPELPELEGTFALITDGRILANNTDEGPSEVGGMQRLEWVINPRTRNAPMALIALD